MQILSIKNQNSGIAACRDDFLNFTFYILISNFHVLSNRYLDTADDVLDNLPGGRTAVSCFGGQENAMRQHIRDEPQHVVRNYKISLLEKCASPGGARQH